MSFVGASLLDRFGVRRAQPHAAANATASVTISPATYDADGGSPVAAADADAHSVALAKCSIRFTNATRQATDTAAAALAVRMLTGVW